MSAVIPGTGPVPAQTENDLNLQTEAHRVLYVVKDLIRKAKVVGMLTELIKQDGFALKKILEPNALRQVLLACERYNVAQDTSAHISMRTENSSNDVLSVSSNTNSDRRLRTDSLTSEQAATTKVRNDEDIMRMVHHLEENIEVQKLVKKREGEMPFRMKCFIKTMEEFKNRMEVRLNQTAQQYKARDAFLRETYEKNELARSEIAKLEEELVVTKTDANVCLIGKNILINRHLNKLEKIKQASEETIEKKIKESEKAMVNDWKQSVLEQERLKTSYQQATEKFNNMLKDHLQGEKMLRAKRAKVENQVMGWIQKFDQDVGEKQAEEEEIQALLDKELNEMREIQKKLEEQEEDYDELMQEKMAFEEEMLERRLRQFVLYRSARRIQRSYRLYKARKLARKGKKGKKGKKDKTEKEGKKEKKEKPEKKEKKEKEEKVKEEVKEEGQVKEENEEIKEVKEEKGKKKGKKEKKKKPKGEVLEMEQMEESEEKPEREEKEEKEEKGEGEDTAEEMQKEYIDEEENEENEAEENAEQEEVMEVKEKKGKKTKKKKEKKGD